jgi:hypothetical protein
VTGVSTQIATAAPTVARWLVAAVAALFASAAGAEVRYLPPATFAAGDKPGDVASYSEAVLTEYRFQYDGHSYAMARALRSVVARDLVFIDDRLVCVVRERRYGKGGWGNDESARFWWDHDHWQAPISKWEWANEPGGLEYLAALLREACGLQPIPERRQLEREWSRRTMTGTEIAETVGEAGAMFAVYLIPAVLTGGYCCESRENNDVRSAVARRNRNDVEQRVWSLTLGLPQEELAAKFGVPDVQYMWPKTGTTVNAYRLGSLDRFFVGLIDGRAAWIHTDYPGLILQAKLAAKRRADTQK